MILTRLVIHKYRGTVPGTELRFGPGINVLLGKNGTGKTTLLDVIARVLRSDFADWRATPFDLEYEQSCGSHTVSVRVKNEAPSLPVLGAPFGWWYRVEVQRQGRVESLTAAWTAPGDPTTPDPFWPMWLQIASGKLRTRWTDEDIFKGHLPFEDWVWRFGEDLSCFDAMVGHPRREEPHFHAQIELIRTAHGVTGPIEPFVPDQVRILLNLRIEELLAGTSVTIDSANLDYLDQAVRVLGFRSAKLTARVLKRERKELGSSVIVGGFEYLFEVDESTSLSHEELSFGQRRLLAYFYYLGCFRHFVVADELVNGLHHAWIEACIDAIGGRQAFLTSQNPLLVDYLEFKSADQVAQSFIRCDVEHRDGRRLFAWRNFSEEDAAGFHSAYEVGIQHVGEILRTRGLW